VDKQDVGTIVNDLKAIATERKKNVPALPVSP
jgi:hypothetical protein